MLQEITESIENNSDSHNQVTTVPVYKCSQAACSGFALAPQMQCTLCNHDVDTEISIVDSVNERSMNGALLPKQARVIQKQITTPMLILSVGRAGIFDARQSPCIITASKLTCKVKVEAGIQTLLFCEELQVVLIKPRDSLKEQLTTNLKLAQSGLYDPASMKWVIAVLGDRMVHSLDRNLSVSQMELFASTVRAADGFCKMDCTLMETRKLLLDCGLRLPRAEARLQTATANTTITITSSSTTEATNQLHSSSVSAAPPKANQEAGLLTTVLNAFTSAEVSLSEHPTVTDAAATTQSESEQKKPEDNDDDIVILSEDNIHYVRPLSASTTGSTMSTENSLSTTTTDSEESTFKFDYQPPGSNDSVTLTQADLDCLAPGALLNDAIINFYLKYLYFEQLTELQRRATYLFNCFFYSRLTNSGPTGGPPATPVSGITTIAAASNIATATVPGTEPTIVARHSNVAKWTRRVDLFQKDYIIIPINEASHWFIGLVCYPWMAGMVSYTALYRAAAFDLCQLTEEFEDVDRIQFTNDVDDRAIIEELVEPRPDDAQGIAFDRWRRRRLAWLRKCGINAMPCILLFDSLPCQSRVGNLHVVRDYLQAEWDSRRSPRDGALHFNKDTIRGFSPRVPSQSNLVDCGIYLLHYVEMFFQQPVKSYTKDYFQNEMASWFSDDTVGQKRANIQALVTKLYEKHKQKTLTAPGNGERSFNV